MANGGFLAAHSGLDRRGSILLSVTIAFILFSPQYGNTALHDAFWKGHPEVVKLLLQSHADMNVKNKVSTE